MIAYSSIKIGNAAEDKARLFLESKGLITVRCNFRCKCGEIDLIMNDSGTLVFVEVRYRISQEYGGAKESITYSKRAKIERTAQFYLQAFKKIPPCRFDAILIEGNHMPEWIRGAW